MPLCQGSREKEERGGLLCCTRYCTSFPRSCGPCFHLLFFAPKVSAWELFCESFAALWWMQNFQKCTAFCMQDRAKRTYFSLIFMVILIKTCLAQACLTREIAFIADSFSPQPHPNLNLDLVQVQNLQKLWFPSLIDFCPLFFLFTNSPWTLQRLLDVNVHNANMQAKLDALLFDDEAFHWIHERCKIYIREQEFLCMVEIEETVNNCAAWRLHRFIMIHLYFSQVASEQVQASTDRTFKHLQVCHHLREGAKLSSF